MAHTPHIHDIHGVLLDVDGTLYRQKPLRRQMVRELLRLPGQVGMGEARRTFGIIRAFRKALEHMRELPPGSGLAAQHYAMAAERAGCSEDDVRSVVREWMFERPLPGIAKHGRRGLREFLVAMRKSGRRVGVLSDYACGAKLEALGVADLVKLRLCCTDPDIDAMKPHPNGFLRATEIWQVLPRHVLYVGDRVSVDGAGAKAAGMMCAIVGKRGIGRSYLGIRDFDDLRDKLERG